jgi:hypothetical protein
VILVGLVASVSLPSLVARRLMPPSVASMSKSLMAERSKLTLPMLEALGAAVGEVRDPRCI